ncbi:MAG: hypothetical protein IBX62_04995 [Coriobacteriia bacterium]|nr:hypothetical protein [Coriobacteriia bacterium]
MTAMRLRSLLLAALVVAALASPAGCAREDGTSEQAEPSRPVPAGIAGYRAVYSVAGRSFYAVALGQGDPEVLLNADGPVGVSMFVAWVPERSELLFETAEEGRKDLWAFREGGEPRLLARDVRGTIGVSGSDVLYATRGAQAALLARDLDGGEPRTLLSGEVLGQVSSSPFAPLCFAVRTEDPRGQALYLVEPGSLEPERIAAVGGARSFGPSFAREGRVTYVELEPGGGAFGRTRYWERGAGGSVDLAAEGSLLDMSGDGSVLLRRNLRGGVSGVQRSLVSYVPSGDAPERVVRQELGAFVGAVHAAAFVADDKVLLSQRIEGRNRLELHDLGARESRLLDEDPAMHVSAIWPLPEADGAVCVRSRPGAESEGGDGEAPSLVTLEDEIVWVPFAPDAEPVPIASTTAGSLRFLGVFAPAGASGE